MSKYNEIEYDFIENCWYGLDDDILQAWWKKFPKLNISYELYDKMQGKFRAEPKKYQNIIQNTYGGNLAFFIWDWLEKEEGWRKERDESTEQY